LSQPAPKNYPTLLISDDQLTQMNDENNSEDITHHKQDKSKLEKL